MKVALLGPEGTYTHEAALKYFKNFEPVWCETITEIFESNTQAKFVPVENSLGGGVRDTIDMLRKRNETVTGEVTLKINHCLISDTELGQINTVKSHPQALSQCSEIIEKNGWSSETTPSTAKAVENLEKGEAALASKTAAKINGLNILENAVQDRNTNTTRFFALNTDIVDKEKTALILEPENDRPGLLNSMLSCFADQGINLSHIQSRPTKRKLGEYYFYVEAETSHDSEEFDKVLKCLEDYTRVKVLGSYAQQR